MREHVNPCRNQGGEYRGGMLPRRRPHVALLIETSLASGRDILRGISRYVREHDPWALYHEPHSLTDALPRWLSRWKGDGIIARIQTPEMAQALARSSIPVVDVLGVVPESPFPLVHVDDEAIARLAAEHLRERGLENFGFFGIRAENWSERRYAAFRQAVAPAHVEMYELPRDASGRRSWERAENRLARWIAALPKPAGVLVCSDQRGSELLEACRRAGVAVPDDVSVIGVDDDQPLCEVCNPPLSSVQPGHARVGYEGALLMDRLLRGGLAPAEPILLPPEGVVSRLSTDTLAITDRAIVAALRLIREQAHQGLTVEALARHVGMSRSVLQRRFRSVLRRSIHQAILGTRMKEAQELLTKTNLPLATVAERTGFRHQEYMGAVFKARLGTTPARLRRDSGLHRNQR
jgi:LacI family transcriptional regulator